ncbi:MAG: heme exporter protein CcmB [Bacteroidetes bacterium]|nr:heme exporter protein CcmB [Bacteroidota bacterium]
MNTNLFTLFKKEIKLELRNHTMVSGLLLFLVCSVFIYYLSFQLHLSLINSFVWSALFWITLLTTSVNTVAKSFMAERDAGTYYYSLLSPESIIMSKVFYNFILCLLMASAGFILFVLFLNNPIQDLRVFILVVILGSFGFASTLTLLSAIAARSESGTLLMAVMGFPILIGILLAAIRVTVNSAEGLDLSVSINSLLMLLSINTITTSVSYLLFPYIWRS